MKKILVVSTSTHEQAVIDEIAQHHNPGGLNVETTGSFAQEATWWTTNAPDLLIIDLPDDDLLQGYFFTKLRTDVPKTQSIIFLCSAISAPLMAMSQTFAKVRILKSPLADFALYRTVVDVMTEYAVGKQQVHPRYLTNQSIEILSDYLDGKLLGQMKNLSMGGAYFESNDENLSIKPGDLVKVSILIGHAQKQYVFDAKVVWSKVQKDPKTTGYGITFVDKEEVYNNLLKTL